jgi:RHS repeat-associated protein
MPSRPGPRPCRAARDLPGGLAARLADASGKRTHTYDYGPTGLPRTTPTEAVPQPFRFAGTYLDPTGLYKMGARYYDPHLGRFAQPRPLGPGGNPLPLRGR